MSGVGQVTNTKAMVLDKGIRTRRTTPEPGVSQVTGRVSRYDKVECNDWDTLTSSDSFFCDFVTKRFLLL